MLLFGDVFRAIATLSLCGDVFRDIWDVFRDIIVRNLSSISYTNPVPIETQVTLLPKKVNEGS